MNKIATLFCLKIYGGTMLLTLNSSMAYKVLFNKNIQFSLIEFSIIISGIFMYIAWNYNPQCEFHCKDLVNWQAWFTVGISWFIVSYVVELIVVLLIIFVFYLI